MSNHTRHFHFECYRSLIILLFNEIVTLLRCCVIRWQKLLLCKNICIQYIRCKLYIYYLCKLKNKCKIEYSNDINDDPIKLDDSVVIQSQLSEMRYNNASIVLRKLKMFILMEFVYSLWELVICSNNENVLYFDMISFDIFHVSSQN